MRLVAALALLLSVAQAEELTPAERQARAHAWFERGRASFKLGDFTAAVREFEEGYKFAAQPLFLYNIAQSARRAGLPQKAVDNYRAYLLVRPDAPERKECEQRIAELEKALPPEKPAVVENPPEKPPEKLPEKLPERLPEKPLEVPPSPSPEPAPILSKSISTPPQIIAVPPPPAHPHREKTIAGAVLTALGIGALGGAVACSAIAVDANNTQHQPNHAFDPSLDARGSAANAGQIALYAMGGAALVSGVVLLALTARDSHRRLAHR
jgi:tetratricopeptide (TPR) repeat protein